jgi:hypothetical protein
MKNAVFRDVTPCDSCKNRRFGGTYSLKHQGDNNRRARNNFSNNQHRSSLPSNCYGIVICTRIVGIKELFNTTAETRSCLETCPLLAYLVERSEIKSMCVQNGNVIKGPIFEPRIIAKGEKSLNSCLWAWQTQDMKKKQRSKNKCSM